MPTCKTCGVQHDSTLGHGHYTCMECEDEQSKRSLIKQAIFHIVTAAATAALTYIITRHG